MADTQLLILLYACLISVVYTAPVQDQLVEENYETGGNDTYVDGGTTPEENLGMELIEGDIVLNPQGRNVINNVDLKWPGGRVPYVITTNHYRAADLALIQSAMQNISSHVSCVKFVPRTTEADYISISSLSGCYSYVGRVGGKQSVSFQNPGCLYLGTIIHEFIHSLGIWHEQSRSDRDQYVQIITANIQSGYQDNFAKLSQSSTQTFGFGYDYGSIMHYSQTSFSVDGRKPTILTKPPGSPIGQRKAMSKTDIGKLTKLYGC